MCENKTHLELNPSAHLTRHTMAVELESSKLRFGREGASVEDAEANAREALELVQANPGIPLDVVCVHFLENVINGALRTSGELQSAR